MEQNIAPDMVAPCGEGLLNIRVGAIIVKNGKALMVKSKFGDYCYSVGGRVKFGIGTHQPQTMLLMAIVVFYSIVTI